MGACPHPSILLLKFIYPRPLAISSDFLKFLLSKVNENFDATNTPASTLRQISETLIKGRHLKMFLSSDSEICLRNSLSVDAPLTCSRSD